MFHWIVLTLHASLFSISLFFHNGFRLSILLKQLQTTHMLQVNMKLSASNNVRVDRVVYWSVDYDMRNVIDSIIKIIWILYWVSMNITIVMASCRTEPFSTRKLQMWLKLYKYNLFFILIKSLAGYSSRTCSLTRIKAYFEPHMNFSVNHITFF